jgi:hypothetical protein
MLVGKNQAEKTKVRRSCVQGSVLGPTLWLIYIQSLTDLLDGMGIEYYAYLCGQPFYSLQNPYRLG